MILGYNTNGFSSHSLVSAIEVIAEIGYGSIGLTIDHHALNPYSARADAELRVCAEALRAAELVPVVETGARFLLDPRNKHSPNLMDSSKEGRAKRVDFLERCVDIAVAIGGTTVSLWSGAATCDGDQALLDARLISGLQEVCDKAGECGVTIAFEPEPGMHVESMADFDRISASFEHSAFKLTLDLGHAFLTEESVESAVERYIGRIANVHVEGMRKPHHDHLVPWDSGFDLRPVLAQLQALGYTGPATLELSRSSHDAVRIARKSFEYLRPNA